MAVSACFVGRFQDQNPGFVKASLSRLFAVLAPYISWTNGPGKGVRLPLLKIWWQVMNQDLAGGKYHRKKGKADCGNVPVTQDIYI